MKKDLEKIFTLVEQLSGEVTELKKIAAMQTEQIEGLKKQLNAVTTVKIQENGKQTVESYGNLILDEIISVKKKLEAVNGLNGTSDVASQEKNIEFSLSDLKNELLKLADMMSE